MREEAFEFWPIERNINGLVATCQLCIHFNGREDLLEREQDLTHVQRRSLTN